MKLARFLPRITRQLGFTMIELLVVIAVIGVLAVAVLSSINPIEQINKGRDTRTRSDAAQLINAVDRYYAIHEVYPWNATSDTYTPVGALLDAPNTLFVFDPADFTAGADTVADWTWADILVDTAEVKSGFVNRLTNDNNIVVLKEAAYNATMYACFMPTSNAFQQEARDNCTDGTTESPVAGVNVCDLDADGTIELELDNLICLP